MIEATVVVDRSKESAPFVVGRWWTARPKSRKPFSWRERGTVPLALWEAYVAAKKAEDAARKRCNRAELALIRAFVPTLSDSGAKE